jgi:transcriptional regulator with XRE-family HTH domain
VAKTLTAASKPLETTVNRFQQRLDDRRRELHLSMQELADRSGLPYSTTRRILKGRMVHPPTERQRLALAKGLRWPVEFLDQGAGEMVHPGLKPVYEDEDLQIVAASWEELSERDRRTIVRMVEEFRRDHHNGG